MSRVINYNIGNLYLKYKKLFAIKYIFGLMLYYFASNIKSNKINMHMDGLKNRIKCIMYMLK